MRRLQAHTKIFIGGALGAGAGVLAARFWSDQPALDAVIRYATRPIGQVFLRLLFMLVVPLVVSALTLGVAKLRDLRSLGRIGARTLAYTVAVSSVAVFIGLGLVNTLRPGAGLSPELKARLAEGAAERAAAFTAMTPAKTGIELLIQIVPDNPVRAAANGDMIALMFFSLMLGIALAVVQTPASLQFEAVLEGLFDATTYLIHLVLRLAPLGVAALLFTVSAELGYEVLIQLGRYVGVVLLGLALHQFVVYSLAVRFLGGMSPRVFFSGIREAMLTAFSTSSSNATLPTAIRVGEEELHLPAHVNRFVLTIGATANQNGTALFEGVTVLFLAQFYGVPLSLGQQAIVVFLCILGGIGTAGVPAGSLPVVAVILTTVGVPIEGIGLILGVDRLLDMCRTVLNVSGDLAAAVVISRGESSAAPGDSVAAA